MDYFLGHIASSVLKEFGNTLNKHCFVFPNRRAGLYFLRHLSSVIDKPVWAPPVYTINELFRSYSNLQVAGNEILLFELYKSYRSLSKSPESFDEFYFWGDMLLNDFDDVDKYLVEAEKLFINVADIRNIDQQFGELTAEQREIISRFWTNFEIEKPTREKAGFTGTWSILSGLYEGFREVLNEKNLAYEGMIFREIAESAEQEVISSTGWDVVHFIGFNALNRCERKLMLVLKSAGKAKFYWDYDNSYIGNGHYNSAGFFMRDNLRTFGNDMPPGWKYDTMLSAGSLLVSRRVIETSSDVAQIKLIPELIASVPGLTPENAHHTAVVLADENLLLPALTSLPEKAGEINITMGYPLRQTLIYTLIRHLMEIQRTPVAPDGNVFFDTAVVLNILKHPLIEALLSGTDITLKDEITAVNTAWINSSRFGSGDRLGMIFSKMTDPVALSSYFRDVLSLIAIHNINDDKTDAVRKGVMNEYIYRIVLSINRLESIIKDPDISFTAETYIRLFDHMLRKQSVPFSGEPLSGIQIMGILETRALDFKNLIILSVNEGVLPAVSSSSSFIPFSLREAFGLPSLNHQESIYAYHFYRLLQRAENVTFAYNSNSEGLRSGEMSRFLIQMNYDKVLKPDFLNLSFEIRSNKAISESIERNAGHVEKLNSRFLVKGKVLSPSAINTWLSCRMKFFYRYVNGLYEPDTITGDIDPATLGNILHGVMKSLYQQHTGKTLGREAVGQIFADDESIRMKVDESIRAELKGGHEGYAAGNEFIVKDVLFSFVKRILHVDMMLAPLTILNLEDSFRFAISLPSGNISAGGIIDRVDVVSGTLRVVDYKTGIVSGSIASIDELFSEDRKKDHDGWLQVLLYCEAYLSQKQDVSLQPVIYRIKKMTGRTLPDKLRIKPDRTSELIIEDYRSIRDEFRNGLQKVSEVIFNPGEPFTMTKDVRNKCSYCPYRILCMK